MNRRKYLLVSESRPCWGPLPVSIPDRPYAAYLPSVPGLWETFYLRQLGIQETFTDAGLTI
jgi:hypothetical protein